MQLSAPQARTDIAAAARAELDRRLLRDVEAPLAVALSGGGDSLALALIAADWAREAGRRLLLLTVDHRLRRESAEWTEACRQTAARLGADFRALSWTDPKPATGLAAAAREARHRLLADAARDAGARVILMGHTASDRAEAAAMRAEGSTTSDPKAWAPSPAWPAGRGVFLLRPLIDQTRTEVRDWLTSCGESWIDDPANADPASARVRARETTADTRPPLEPVGPVRMAEAAAVDASQGLVVSRAVLRDSPAAERHAFVRAAAVCAGGGGQLTETSKVERLADLLASDETVVATLAGARIEAEDRIVAFRREAGETRRRGLTSLYLTPDQPVIWDGRFELVARRGGLHVQHLEGLSRKLDPDVQAMLRKLPVSARPVLPALIGETAIACPALQPVDGVEVRGLVADRFYAACGLIEREPQ